MNGEKICVGCERQLRGGEAFGFKRGRLWHQECFTLFRGKTREERDAQVAASRAAEATSKLAYAESRLRILERDREQRLDLLRRDVDRLNAENASLQAKVASSMERSEAERLRRRASSMERELANTQAELLTARRSLEVAIATVAAGAPAPSPPATTPAAPEDDRDGTEIRFSLLDLD